MVYLTNECNKLRFEVNPQQGISPTTTPAKCNKLRFEVNPQRRFTRRARSAKCNKLRFEVNPQHQCGMLPEAVNVTNSDLKSIHNYPPCF